jgi:hypothetical protein
MCRKVFEDLTSDEFILSAGLVSTPEALRRFLLRSHAIHGIRESLRQGLITDETIREFISSLMKEFSVGRRFAHEMALAALAVALERRPTNYAEEFLSDLAKLRLAEMPLCIRVARECLKHRATVARNAHKDFSACPWPSKLGCRQVKSNPSRSPVSTPTVHGWFNARLNDAKA